MAPEGRIAHGVPAGEAAFDEGRIRQILAAHAGVEGPLLPILHAIQAEYGWIPDGIVPVLAKALNLSRAEVHGTISFYHDFRRSPPPAHVVRLCRAEACQAMGGEALADHARERLAGEAGVALEEVFCLGNCAAAPSATVDGRLVGRLDPGRLDACLAPLLSGSRR